MIDSKDEKERLRSMLPDYLEMAGVNPRKAFCCISRSHADVHPSMGYDQARARVHCFSCGCSLDIFGAIGEIDGIASFAGQMARARELFPNFQEKANGASVKKKTLRIGGGGASIASCRDAFAGSDGEKYLAGRGISSKIAIDSGVGWDRRGSVVFPCHNGNYAYRPVKDGGKTKNSRGDAGFFECRMDAAGPVFVVEGAVDALSVGEAGFSCIALNSANNQRIFLAEGLERLGGREIAVMMDSDGEGQRAQEKLCAALLQKGAPHFPVFMPEGAGKDANEYMQKDRGGFFNFVKQAAQRQNGILRMRLRKGAAYIDPFGDSARYKWNDIGMGNLFADTYKNMARFVPEAKMWYVYDGAAWRQDTGGVIVAELAKELTWHMLGCCVSLSDESENGAKSPREMWLSFVNSRMSREKRKTMVEDASSVYPLSILAFDKDPWLFNCQNATLDLRNFTVHEHRPGDFLSKVSGAKYEAGKKFERWEGFVDQVTQGDKSMAEFLQKALGYSLSGDTSEECFFILYGATTRNGKGTCMETVLRVMGDYGRSAQPDTLNNRQKSGSEPSEDVARLKGARFVAMSEPSKGLRLNSALVKQITGGDTVTARYLHQNSFEYRPEYKLYISANHLPKIADDSVFASGRVKIIPFGRHFEPNEQDKGLKSLFSQPENAPAILNWLLDGLTLMRAEGLSQPEAVKKATSDYREESDVVGLFMKECLLPEQSAKTKTKDAYAAYETWCRENGHRPLNASALVSEWKARGVCKRDNSMGNILYGLVISNG